MNRGLASEPIYCRRFQLNRQPMLSGFTAAIKIGCGKQRSLRGYSPLFDAIARSDRVKAHAL